MIRVVFLTLVLFMVSCIDDLNIATEETLRVLVVEGGITTEPGPHYIYLSKSAKYGTVFEDFSKKVSRAFVRIRDQKGNQIILSETDAGTYETPRSFKAEVGSSYSLVIETTNGESYSSIPEEVIEVPQIESLSLNYKRLPSISENLFDHGIEVYSNFQDNSDRQDYLMYRNSGLFLVQTQPENFIVVNGNGNEIPAPKDCCSVCYVSETNGDSELRVLSDQDFNGNNTSQLASFILDDGARYVDKYMIRIHQHSLTSEAYRFFDLLKNQLSIGGNLFDPPPATLRGNMININEPQSPVIGYFFASDVSSDSIFLNRELLDSPYLDLRYADDCRTIKNSTTERPSFW